MSNTLPHTVFVGLEQWRGDWYNSWHYFPTEETKERYVKENDYKWSQIRFNDDGSCPFQSIQEALGLTVDESVECTYEIAVRKL